MNPIVNVIEAIPQLINENKGGVGDLIRKNYGSAEECQIDILQVQIRGRYILVASYVIKYQSDVHVFH